MSDRSTLLTRATALTLLRLCLVPLLAWTIVAESWLAASLIFWLAVATDFADGCVARRYDEVTRLGGVIDHTVDALFVSVGCAALGSLGILPLALAAVIVLAFIQYAADSRIFAAQGLRASQLGRWNGIAYYVIVAVPIIRDALGWSWPGPGLVLTLGWLLVASTLLSMIGRFWQFILGQRARDSPA